MEKSVESSLPSATESQINSSGGSILSSSEGNDGSKGWKLFNIVMLGITFMCLFTAFQTCAMVETLVLEGANNETNHTSGNGYTSLALLYGSFAVSNWVAPSVVALFGSKWAMIAGGSLYCLFIGLFLKPMQETLYTSSILVGLGAAVLWTAQGKFLAQNSNLNTMTRNTGIFWALFQSSLIWGNLFVYFKFSGVQEINSSVRTILFISLTVVGCFGVLLMLLFRSPSKRSNEPKESMKEVFVRSLQLIVTKEMMMLAVLFLYTGLETSFWSSVFITSVGHTKHFGTQAKQLVGFSGLATGLGQILGGLLFGILGNCAPSKRPDKSLVVFIGFLAHITSFFLIFLTFHPLSPLVEVSGFSYFAPNMYIVLGCAFLLGFGDSAFNTQIYPILCLIFPVDISSACALFKFLQSLAAASAFVYSLKLLLHWQLLILAIMSLMGTFFFFLADRSSKAKIMSQYAKI